MKYIPTRVLFEEKALDYPLGTKLYEDFKEKGIYVNILKSGRVTEIPGTTAQNAYAEGKNTLVIRVRKNKEFQTCKPSAHYQLPLVAGCSGKCEYCYLNTRFGNKPYTTIYVNVDEILQKAKHYIDNGKPELTLFEAAATSDPIPFEEFTGTLYKTIEFIGNEKYGRLRFVTKFTNVDNLLKAKHNGHTTIRFSINTRKVIDEYEHGTSNLSERIEAARKILDSGYRLGFIIGPVILYKNWEDEYLLMLKTLRDNLGSSTRNEIYFEVISHRFTQAAKNKILEVFPKTTLPMNEENRSFKYGQFGYGKYVYNREDLNNMKDFFEKNLSLIFPEGKVEYII